MDALHGVWRLVASKAWDEAGNDLPPPYGRDPIGQITFTTHGRMLAALCNGDPGMAGARGFSSYGGRFTIEGDILAVAVDMASNPERIGGRQVRQFRLEARRMILRPPPRAYGGSTEQRELEWERVWRPAT